MKITKKLIYIIMCAVVSATAVSSCSDFLDEYSQDQYYAHNWEDLDELLIGSGYMDYQVPQHPSLWSSTQDGSFVHFLTDDIDENVTAVSQSYDDQDTYFGNFTWQERTGVKPEMTEYNAENPTWTRCYYHINVCNNIIASLNDIEVKDDEDRLGYHKVSGEAHFIRAYLYFFLVNLYGKPYDENAATNPGVPLKLSEDVVDIKFTRNTVKEVYDQVLADLETARTELSQYTKAQKSYYRADSVAADLLSARVYLYMQDWENARTYANKVIAEHPALEDLNSPTEEYFHSADNVENIFSMGSDNVPTIMSYNLKCLTATKDLYNLYETQDLRKTQWYWTMGDFVGVTKILAHPTYWWTTYTTNDPHYYEYAYYENASAYNTYFSTVFGLRSAEAYLIKAEAAAYLGEENEARTAINNLRVKRYSSNYGGYKIISSGDELIQEIRDERRRELCFEGQRWFDLRRYCVNSVLPESHEIQHTFTYYQDRESAKAVQRVRYTLEPYDEAYTLPIPYEVIEFNTGMEQNKRPNRQPEVLPLDNTDN